MAKPLILDNNYYGAITDAAKALGVHQNTLRRKIKKKTIAVKFITEEEYMKHLEKNNNQKFKEILAKEKARNERLRKQAKKRSLTVDKKSYKGTIAEQNLQAERAYNRHINGALSWATPQQLREQR